MRASASPIEVTTMRWSSGSATTASAVVSAVSTVCPHSDLVRLLSLDEHIIHQVELMQYLCPAVLRIELICGEFRAGNLFTQLLCRLERLTPENPLPVICEVTDLGEVLVREPLEQRTDHHITPVPIPLLQLRPLLLDRRDRS